MRTPDQDERPEPGTADDALGDGFGSVDQGDLSEGYGTDDFYESSYDPTDVDVDDDYDTDDTFDDAPDDHGGFGGTGDGVPGDADGGGDVVPVGSEVSDGEAENVLIDILDDVFGDDADEVLDDMEATYGMDASEILVSLGDNYAVDDDGSGFSPAGPSDDGGVFDNNPFDGQPDGDAADFATQSDFDLNTDGHVDQGDLHEATHSFDFHVEGG
jgi:hypothetical protein